MIHEVPISKLTPESFAPYGSVVQIPPDRAGVSPAEHGDFYPNLGIMRIDGEFQVAQGLLFKRPFRFNRMERHLRTMELMVPLNGTTLVPVAAATDMDPDSGPPPVESIRIFELTEMQGMILNVGVWHWSPMPLKDRTAQIVLFAVGAEKDDLIIKAYPKGTFVDVVFDEASAPQDEHA